MNRVLWRAAALAAALTLVAGVAQVSGAPKPKISPAQVTGTYTYVYPTDPAANLRTVTLQAVGTTPAQGTFSWTVAAKGRYLIGSVTCVQVVGQDAWVAGRVKKSDPGDSSYGGILFRIHPDDTAPLGFQVVTGVEYTTAAAVADCMARDTSSDSYLAPILSGHMTVIPAGLSVYSFDASFSAMAQLTPVTAAGHGMVGVILPDATPSARYASFDAPYLTKAFTDAGYTRRQFRIDNASGTISELALAQADIAAGAKILIVDPLDGPTGKSIQTLAAAAGIPYISYDRATFQGTTTYHVDFDGVQVGKLIGRYFMQCVTDWNVASPQVFELDGGKDTDPNAISFAAGYNNVLWGTALTNNSQIAAGTTNSAGYYLVGDEFVPGWDNSVAQSMFQTAFTAYPAINATVEANDGLANAVITVLKGAGVGPKTIPTVGQDATLQAMENILLGYQCGSVYKPLYLEAQAAVALATYLRAGQTPPAALINGTTTDPANPAITEPAVLLPASWVNAANMETTVIKDKFVSVRDLCTSVGASVCRAAGIH